MENEAAATDYEDLYSDIMGIDSVQVSADYAIKDIKLDEMKPSSSTGSLQVTSALLLTDLHWWTTDADLWKICSTAGAHLPNITLFQTNPMNGKSLGNAYLSFPDMESAQLVYQKLNRDPQKMKVSYVAPSESPFDKLQQNPIPTAPLKQQQNVNEFVSVLKQEKRPAQRPPPSKDIRERSRSPSHRSRDRSRERSKRSSEHGRSRRSKSRERRHKSRDRTDRHCRDERHSSRRSPDIYNEARSRRRPSPDSERH